MDAAEALNRLKEGNARFAAGKPSAKDFAAQRKAALGGQSPYAIVLYCSDSRVPAEYIFDAGIGEIFGIRDAGNIVDAITLGSIEYAAEHLNVPLLVVLGHTKCGAVTAACQSGHAPGNIASVVAEIQAAAKAGGNVPEAAVRENIKCVLEKIRAKSGIVSSLEAQGKLRVASALYSLETGAVQFL
ncbi:MAG: carbonic anhydrase [Candidatus Micrarchaeia archaeon]|jgi:carbonic anhydrase